MIPRKDVTDGTELARLLSCRRYSGILGLTSISRVDCGFGIKTGESSADDLISGTLASEIHLLLSKHIFITL
jgi:hypothetical protein